MAGTSWGLTTLASAFHPRSIAVDASGVYWANGDRGMQTVAIDGGRVTTFNGSLQTWAVALDATSVYWTGYNPFSPAGTENKLLETASTKTDFISGLVAEPTGIAVDAANVYWIGEDFSIPSRSVVAMPKDGGKPIVLASSQRWRVHRNPRYLGGSGKVPR